MKTIFVITDGVSMGVTEWNEIGLLDGSAHGYKYVLILVGSGISLNGKRCGSDIISLFGSNIKNDVLEGMGVHHMERYLEGISSYDLGQRLFMMI